MSDSGLKLLGALVVIALVIWLIVWLVRKNNGLPKSGRMMARPMMMRNGRVVSPYMNRKEGFTDQYTANIPISANNPIWLNSVPDSSSNPWVGSIPGEY